MFPTLVYKDGGIHQRRGGTYSYCKAEDKDQFKALLKEGWSPSLEEALGEKKAEIVEEVAESEIPTREELEEMASELGIKPKANWKDETLAKKINEALEK